MKKSPSLIPRDPPRLATSPSAYKNNEGELGLVLTLSQLSADVLGEQAVMNKGGWSHLAQ